ncbi:hypothetical protein QZH41_018527, partial [Actinostola sp. cb2023]
TMDPRIQWLNRVQMPIQKAMQCGRYEEALHHINNALMSVSAVSAAPQVVCGLWSNRAECQWQMRQYQQCLEDLNQAHVLGAHPSPSQKGLLGLVQNAYEKWIARSEQLLDSNLPHADAYFEFCLRVLSSNHKEHARCCILWGVTKIIFSDRTQGTQLIVKGMNLDWNVLKEYLAHWKSAGIAAMRDHDYLRAKQLLQRALIASIDRSHIETRRSILSHLASVHFELKEYDKALEAGRQSFVDTGGTCVGHYRLGSSFVGLQRYREGCVAFCNAFNFADESDKLDVLLQILSAAVKLPAGLEGIHLSVPKAMVQDLIKRFVLNKDWVKLSLLFLGGGGANEHKYGRGGLATGCDASGVPLELIVDFSTITSVNLAKLVDVLIKDGAPFMGSPGCAESPLKIAVRKKNKELLDVLSKYDKSRATDWLQKGAQAFEEGNYGKAITLLSTAVKGELNFEQQMLAYHHLSDACYITEEYRDCIEYASKAHSKEPLQSKGMSETWKQRGNELLKLKLYDLMSDYYSLALRYAPPDCNELRAAVYSNRSMAYVNRNMIRDAKADARRCIELRKTWFRGYSRLAACWTAEDNHQEAIDEYCRGLRAVKVENEKSCLVADIVATSMKLADGAITIPVNIPTKLINVVVKQAVNDKDVEKLRHLLVEKRCQPPGSMDLRCLGHYADCAACVPLEMVMESNVQDKYILIEELLSRGSSPNGHPNCNKEPIVLAMNECNYKIAAMLLRHGANPQFILINRQEPFDPRAPHFSQWLSLGRKALKSREFVRAKQFYSLALEYPEAAKDKSAKCEALRALSDISFELRWYDDCILKGRDCFKVSPIKSEIEAVKWQQRGQVLATKEMHDEVPSYLTLAMNYAPPSNEKLRFELLCLRSNAYRAINDYSQAIEDGKSATAIKPDEVEGHMCLVSCYKNLQRPSKTFSALIQCLKAVGHSIVQQQYLREALDIAVNLPGDVQILEILLNSGHSDIENVRDSNGNSLYNRAMSGKINNNKCKVVKRLINAKVNPDIPNKHGKRPIDCCNKRDDRNRMLQKFIKEYTPKPVEENKQHSRTENNKDSQLLLSTKEHQEEIIEERVSETSEEQDLDVEEPQPSPINVKQSKSEVDITKRKKEEERKYLQCLIENLIIEEPDVSTQQKLSEEAIADELIEEHAENEEQENMLETCREEGETPPQTENNEEAGDEADETTSHFENLTWEVDCTENVWKTMRSKKVTEKTKKQVIEKIRMLAEGRWSSKKLCKRLEGEPKERGILLYESRLTRSARIIWEKTIAFSPRCSNDPELRLSASDHGLIYSDIIRVWDIVLDHGDLDHRIQNVVKSHDRGSHCIIKSNLKGMKKHKQDSNNQLSLPSYYQERKKSSDEQPAMEYNDVFFPPASSEENEYHILKFYSFTSALIDTLLDGDQKTKIDFPFKVTELEHAIINLKPDKACTIILLGRSGTGKTTCCLYRLWTEFQNYWEKAVTAGPHLPKYVPAETTGDEEERSVSETRSDVPSQAMAAVPSHQSSETERNLYFSEPSSEYVDPDEKATEAMEIQEAEDNSPGYYEHLHQMFITKNTVLCSEVQKNFKELRNAGPDTKAMTVSEDSLPNHIKDIGEKAWPLFVGARDWLLLLDASLPGIPFFQRTADGSLLGEIEGWGQEDMHLHFIPDDDDEEDELEEEGEHAHAVAEKEDQKNPKSSKARSNKREVTYQVFMNELWPKMKKSVKNDYHPTLVWTEIRSFIKGSAEALKTSTGYLSCDEYKELGRKRAPNFMGDRSTVYQLFTSYQNIIRSSKRMFDEADLVYNLHNRLMENRELEWSIHNIYVDETQDFTQAELSLLIHCCRFPNRMFFTGDTAQSIMRGIAFRFEDLKTLFHAIKTSDLLTSKEPVRVPDRLYQLTHNYRSHAGILRLASSIVNLLLHYFPESFDKLDKDCGLFDGPKPVLLESCSLTDLAMILRGNKRHASRIEFGAHQAVLVVSEEARDNMPEELKHGLVLTIYEAKGLEFDDVLIYNFFKDSHARKEWRVVASYIGKCQAEGHSGVTGLVEIREEDLNLKTRPLEFNHEKHKVLNSELKFLYTAITRARVNVWFFDEDEENRGPMFEYFRSLDLVRAITLDDQDERSTTTLTSMFAEGSDKFVWRDQGWFFYNKGLWDVAGKCYAFGEYEIMVRKCKAQKQAQEAFKCRSNPKQMKEKFCIAATQFLECSMPDEAVVCLHNAREKLLLAMLYKKMERFAEASKIFRSERCCEEASQCMEQMNNYNQAIEIFCEAKLYENAIQVLERRMAVLKKQPELLVDDDSKEDAARFLQLHGRFKEAMKYSKDHKFLADCNLYEARSLPNSGNQETIEALLKDAIKYYSRCGDKNGEAEALLLVGRQRNDIHNITESGKIFHINSNVCGEVEVVEDWLEHDVDQFYYRIIVRAMERVLELIINLHKPYTQLKTDKQKTIAVCEQFFGLSRVQDQNVRRYRTKTLERFQQLPHRDISYQDHELKELHRINVLEFEEYKEFYITSVEKVLDQAKSLNDKDTKELDLDVDINGLNELRQKVWRIVQDIEKDKKWKDIKGLKPLVKKVQKKIQEIKKTTEE